MPLHISEFGIESFHKNIDFSMGSSLKFVVNKNSKLVKMEHKCWSRDYKLTKLINTFWNKVRETCNCNMGFVRKSILRV